MNKIILALTVLCLVFAPTSIVQAQSNGETVNINPSFAPDTVYVSTSDYIVLTNGWLTCGRGFVKDYLSAVHVELSLNGVALAEINGKSQYWDPITEGSGGSVLEYCIGGNRKSVWLARWNYPLGTLAPGEYELYYKNWLDHPVIDGFDADQDGRPNMFRGIRAERTITIVVQ